jgi:hypothetical protein
MSSSVTLVESPPPKLDGTRRPRKLTRRRTQSNAEEPWLVVEELKKKEENGKSTPESQALGGKDSNIMDQKALMISARR